ncbi:MAG: type II secretion system secretin GspD [Pseudomonadota bacterium]
MIFLIKPPDRRCNPVILLVSLGIFISLLLACSPRQITRPPLPSSPSAVSQPAALADPADTALTTSLSAQSDSSPGFYRPGSDQLTAKPHVAAESVQPEGSITLNFHNASLAGVVKIVLGDMLKVNYVLDPGVQGSVSMQTSQPLARSDLVPTLELLLRMHQAALIVQDGLYQVVPMNQAISGVRQPQLGDSHLPLPSGFSVRVVPLRFVAADEMAQILEPFALGANQLVRVDTQRNLLVLAASSAEMSRLLEMIHLFDVDRMRGMSVALFVPDFVDAKTLGDELERLLNDKESGLMKGLVRLMVIERLNGLMVVTPRARYLALVREWVQRLDQAQGRVGQQLFVYRVQHGKASDLAAMLNQVFQPQRQGVSKVTLAPGLRPVQVGTKSPGAVVSSGDGADVRIIADEPNNALLFLTDGATYKHILRALKQLDVSPMQVLVEVTIAEVSLNDKLQYGVEWFFSNQVDSGYSGLGTLDLGNSGINPLVPGFAYAFRGSGDVVKAMLNALATESQLSIVASPTLLVLNNQEALIQVGDEVPVSTQQQQATATDANIINSIEYRQTGVMLKVKPRINAGGLVILQVAQEASLVPGANNADPLTPRIQTRKISSTIAVNSGDTIMLGGLIENNQDRSAAGIPGLNRLPLIGHLLSTTADFKDLTVLLILITPRAISQRTHLLQATESFRRRLQHLIPTAEESEQR